MNTMKKRNMSVLLQNCSDVLMGTTNTNYSNHYKSFMNSDPLLVWEFK